MANQSKALTEHLTEEDVHKLVESYLNKTQPSKDEVHRIRLMLKLGVEPILAYIYERGYTDGERG